MSFYLVAINFHFPKYNTFFQSVFFFIFRAHRFLEVAFCWNIRKFRFLKYKDFFLRDFYFRKHKKSFLLIKYKKFLNIRAPKFHFPIYKEFLELESYFLKYKTVFRVFLSFLILELESSISWKQDNFF